MKQLFMVTPYHKSCALHEEVAKPISRFPDPTNSALYYVYLLLIKPYQAVLIQKFYFLYRYSTARLSVRGIRFHVML